MNKKPSKSTDFKQPLSLAEGMFGPLFALFANRLGGSILDITWA